MISSASPSLNGPAWRLARAAFVTLVIFGVAAGCSGSDSADESGSEATSSTGTDDQAAAADDQASAAGDAPTDDDSVSAAADSESDTANAESELAGVSVVPFEGGVHVEDFVEYRTDPPVGGDHNPGWQNCGFYSVELPNEQAVHSLEHSAIWITWAPDVEESEIVAIEAFASANDWVLASPYSNQDSPIVLTAWGRQARIATFSDPLVNQFFETYAGAASPTAPEAGALCEKAYGIPPDDTQTIG